MADATYVPKVYHKQGGDELIVASGGVLDVESGGAFKLGGVAVTSTAAELNLIDGADRAVRVARVALAALDTAGGILAWANPTGGTILVERILVHVTTKTTGACTADFGVAANGTTLNDTLLDGVDVGAATGLFDNLNDAGTNGKSRLIVTSTQFVTGSMASGAAAGLVGFAYIHYLVI